MFIKKETLFANGHILTKDMLELVYRWPRQLLGLYSQQLSDGILGGLDYQAQGDDLVIKPGILHYQGDFWFLEQDFSFKTFLAAKKPEEGGRYALRLTKGQDENQGEVTVSSLHYKLERSSGKYDLGAFSSYWKLPRDWDELIVSLNNGRYFHLENIPWAAPQEATFHRFVFSCLAEKLAQKKIRTSLETLMLAQIYERGTLTLSTLRLYTGDSPEVTRADLLKHMDKKLKETATAEPQLKTEISSAKHQRPLREKPGRI